jgi:hypothetical protein
MGASFAELVLVGAVVWILARALEPLRRRMERALLRLLAPDRAEIIDAVIQNINKKRKE